MAPSGFPLTHYALFDSPPIPDALYYHIQPRMAYARSFFGAREPYLARKDVDEAIFGTFWGKDCFYTFAERISLADRFMLNRLRLIYNFTGVPLTPYRRAETFPVIDPIYQRYVKLRAVTPPPFRFVAPALCGEAGWKLDGGLVNPDVAFMQERLQFLMYSGLLQHLLTLGHTPSVLEIGAGCGLLALALYQSLAGRCRYMICDVPEVLAVSFAYLNITRPNEPHYVVQPDGIHDVCNGRRIGNMDCIGAIDRGFIYIPNYMMHEVARHLQCDMVLNAMSLHEMRKAQIEYYCQASKAALVQRNGFFFEINAHAHQQNNVTSHPLQTVFEHNLPLNLTDIGLSGHVWCSDKAIIDKVAQTLAESRSFYDLDALFSIEIPYEYPSFCPDTARRVLNEDLGNSIGFDFIAWMKERGYEFCTPLERYRTRFGLAQP